VLYLRRAPARCNVNVETDLLSLAIDIVEESRETLKELNGEYRKLEKKLEAMPEQPDQPA